MTNLENKIDLSKLKATMPYQWRVQSFSKTKASCSCVAYIDARDVMNRLDDVCGAENWQDDYRVIHNQLVAGIGIFLNNQWIWKWDTGTESQTEKEKGLFSDSFKRAAVKWGVGRFLYDLEIQYLDANETKKDNNYPFPVDDQKKRIWDVTKFINDKLSGKAQPAPKVEVKEKPYLNEQSDAFKKAKEFISTGQGTLEDIEKKYNVSESVAKLLTGN